MAKRTRRGYWVWDTTVLRIIRGTVIRYGNTARTERGLARHRWFLDRIATHILAYEGDSNVVWFEGNYADYETDRRRRTGEDANQPHRIKYKKLSRD